MNDVYQNRLFNIYGDDKGTGYAGNVWDINGLSPTLTTSQGGQREPMIIEPLIKKIGEVTENSQGGSVYDPNGISQALCAGTHGYAMGNIIEDTCYGTYSNDSEAFSKPPLKDLSRCLKAEKHDSCVIEPCICASRGRNPENPSDRTSGLETEQRLEVNENGTSNTLTSVQKDNYVIEPIALDEQNKCLRYDGTVGTLTTDGSTPKHNNRVVEPKLVGGVGEINWGKQYHQGNRIYDSEEIAMCLNSQPVGNTGGYSYLYKVEKPTYRIRKLTPKECIRLMDFDDSDYDKIKAIGISDSQIYKQCGNSIVVACLKGIFDKMFIHTEVENEQLSLF